MPPTRSASRTSSRPAKFSAFTVANTTKKGKVKKQTVAREEGIHSQSWALAIVPQWQNGFLRLPLELRQKIYRYCFVAKNKTAVIAPKKFYQRFENVGFIFDPEGNSFRITKRYTKLIHISRQVYMDVVFLLYQESTFRFASFYAANLYLRTINPMKVRSITSIDLTLPLDHESEILSPQLIRILSSLPSLKQITLQMKVDSTVLEEGPICPISGHRQATTDVPIRAEALGEWKKAKWEFLGKFEALSKLDMIIRPRYTYKYKIKDSPQLQSFAAEVITLSGIAVSLTVGPEYRYPHFRPRKWNEFT